MFDCVFMPILILLHIIYSDKIIINCLCFTVCVASRCACFHMEIGANCVES